MRVRILIADDHKIVREGLRNLLQNEKDVEVVAEASDGNAAVRKALELRPDVVIMDVAMSGLNGVEATRKITEQSNIKVVALSMHSDKRFITAMLKAGASAYLLKDCAFEELVSAIRAVAAGQTYLSPRIAGIITKEFVHHLKEEDTSAFAVLTPREREVLQLLAEGWSTKRIAAHLNLSTKTIETHRSNIMNKLNIYTLPELTKYALREGLTSLDT